MDVILQHMDPELWPSPEGWIVVGRVGHLALAYDPERRPHLIGEGDPQPLDPAEVNTALAPAVDAAATRLWPDGWSYAMADTFHLNRRSLNRDRIARFGMHPRVLRVLGEMSCHADADGIGRLMLALSFYADHHGEGTDMIDRLADAGRVTGLALDALREVRSGRVTMRPEGDADK